MDDQQQDKEVDELRQAADEAPDAASDPADIEARQLTRSTATTGADLDTSAGAGRSDGGGPVESPRGPS